MSDFVKLDFYGFKIERFQTLESMFHLYDFPAVNKRFQSHLFPPVSDLAKSKFRPFFRDQPDPAELPVCFLERCDERGSEHTGLLSLLGLFTALLLLQPLPAPLRMPHFQTPSWLNGSPHLQALQSASKSRNQGTTPSTQLFS